MTTPPREAARTIWAAALAAGDVVPLVERALARADALDFAPHGRLFVLGCGKASGAMAAAVERSLGARIAAGVVVVKDGYRVPTRTIRLLEAGHPVPDARGRAASDDLLALARTAGPDDLVLVLISGGGSALTPAPAPPVTLEEKQTVTRLLLAAGATINDLNAVRKHLSRFKGGQLARAIAPASTLSLILSDVVGDPLDVIASGPTAPDPTTFADALAILKDRGLLEKAPASVLSRLRAGADGRVQETPKPGDPLFARVSNLVIGNNALVLTAAVDAATALGYRVEVLSRGLQGEARDVARDMVARARLLAPPACLIAVGETTVTVRGTGRGGRCQEFALAAARELRAGEPMVLLAAGTDGTDGPTDAAGALVDGLTLARGQARGLDAGHALRDNDANAFLAASGDLVVTGPTNTNLLDLYIALHP